MGQFDNPADAVAYIKNLEKGLAALAVQVGTAPPQARVFNSANITGIGSGSRVALTFNSERYDSGGLHSAGRLTAPVAGVYTIGACVQFAANATGKRQLELQLNGSTLIEIDGRAAIGGGEPTICHVGTDYQLAAGDYVEVTVVQTSGGALNIEAATAYSPEFWMTWLGPAAG